MLWSFWRHNNPKWLCGPQTVSGEDRVKGSGWLLHNITYDSTVIPYYDQRTCCRDFGFTGVAAQIPEPATLLLTSLGLVGLISLRRRQSVSI